MGTKRLIFLIIISFAAIAILLLFFFIWTINQDNRQYNPIDAIPQNACIVIEVENFESFATAFRSNTVAIKLSRSFWLTRFSKILNFSDSLYRSDIAFQKYIGKNNLVAAYFNHDSKSFEELYVIKLPEGAGKNEIFEFIRLQAIGIAKTNDDSVDGHACIAVQSDEGWYWFSDVGNLLLVSSSKPLLKMAIDKLIDGNGQNDNAFAAIYATSAKGVAANIFINTRKLSQILTIRDNLSYLKEIADWVGLEVQFSDKQLLANGLISVTDTAKRFYSVFIHQKPLGFTLNSFMPIGTSFFVWYGISDLAKFLNDYRDYIDNIRLTDPYNKNLSKFLSDFGISFEEFLIRNFGNEVCVLNARFDGNTQPQWLYFLRVKSGSAALNEIINLAAKQDVKIEEANLNYSGQAIIIKNPIQSYIPILFGNHFLQVNDAYILVLDNMLIFGPDLPTLDQVAKAYFQNNTLSHSDGFVHELQRLSSTSNLIFYSAGLSNPALMDFTLMGKPLGADMNLDESVSHLTWQVVGGTPKLFTILVVSGPMGKTTISAKTDSTLLQSIWRCQLNTKPIGKIHLLRNHANGEAELLVQDEDNTIYLISKNGHILWNRKIYAQIKGDVIQADLFRNGKLQMLFVAGRQIFAIDRNGNDVKGFPLTLKAEPTSPLSVFDYDRQKYYRLMVACSDKKLYCYNGTGKIVTDWHQFTTETLVYDRIGLVQLSGKDYIVVFDQNRPYLLNRKGTQRVRIGNFFRKASNAEYYLDVDVKGKHHIVTTDTLGIVKRIYFDGRVESISIKPFSSNHTFRLIKGKSKRYYAFMENNTISLYDTKGRLSSVAVSKGNFDTGQLQAIRISGTDLIVASASNKLNIYDINGKPLENLMILSTVPIHIINENNHFVTMSKEHGIVCFPIK